MSKLLGFLLLASGSIMLYYGWRSHELASSNMVGSVSHSAGSESVWLLTLGTVAIVWGLAIALRRRV